MVAESEQLRQARAAALELLDRDADLSELRDSAYGLGLALVNAADDEDLWTRLSGAGERVGTLTEEQRLELRGALSIDWTDLLDQVGYQPPPPSFVYAEELAPAIQMALQTRDAANVEVARAKLRQLGQKLVELSGLEVVPPSRLRRWLRRGVRVAGKLLVVVGVAAAGVAILHAPPLLAVIKHAPFLADVAVDVLKDGATRVLDYALDRALPPDNDESDADDPSDREALELISSIRDGELGKLQISWDLAAAQALPSPLPIDETLRVVNHATRAVYRAWDLAIGAPWYDRRLAADLEKLATDLRLLHDDLTDKEPDALAVAKALRDFSEVLSRVKRPFSTGQEPHSEPG